MTLRVIEQFTSIQGEGHYTGVPSVFVRLFGCNFTCANFSKSSRKILGVDRNGAVVYVDEVYLPDEPRDDLVGFVEDDQPDGMACELVDVRPDSGSDHWLTYVRRKKIHEPQSGVGLKTLDQVSGDDFKIGCDSRYSWDPTFKHLSVPHTPHQLYLAIKSECERTGVSHVVLTGGEPVLHANELASVIKMFNHVDAVTSWTFETNSSVMPSPLLLDALREWVNLRGGRTVLWSNSPKLAHSGESRDKRINPVAFMAQGMLRQAVNKVIPGAIIQTCKYVVGPEDDHFLEAQALHRELAQMSEDKHPWSKVTAIYPAMAMPLGADVEQYRAHAPGVAERCIRYGFRYCARQHLELYGNRIGT